jgi:hypothetical protein
LNCTVARSATQAHAGSNSLAITATGTGQMNVGLSTPWPSTSAGLTLTASLWIYQTVGSHFPTFYLRYASSVNNFLQDFTSNPTESTNAWYQASTSGLAPSGTISARIEVSWFSMSAGEVIYIDDASLDDGVTASLPSRRLVFPESVRRAAVR